MTVVHPGISVTKGLVRQSTAMATFEGVMVPLLMRLCSILAPLMTIMLVRRLPRCC